MAHSFKKILHPQRDTGIRAKIESRLSSDTYQPNPPNNASEIRRIFLSHSSSSSSSLFRQPLVDDEFVTRCLHLIRSFAESVAV